jgi:hypothetical protein
MRLSTTPFLVMESHDISSPPLPALYHEAMVAYHAFTVRGKPGENFLTFWYNMDSTLHSSNRSPSEPSDYSIDILKGILVLRDEVASSTSTKIRSKKFKYLLTRIRNNSVFPETVEYWDTVMSGLDVEDGISVSEISEAVLQFLRNLASAETVSRTTSEAAGMDDLERLRAFVQQSLENLKQEQDQLKEKIEEVATTTHSTPRPTPPELPIPSRRARAVQPPPRRACCGSVAEDCLIQ